jgi:hypothetical protein
MLRDQVKNETEEQRRKRLLQMSSNPGLGASMSLFGLGGTPGAGRGY